MNQWRLASRTLPFVRLLLPYLLGLIIANWFNLLVLPKIFYGGLLVIFLLSLCLVFIHFPYRYRFLSGVGVSLLLFGLGMLQMQNAQQRLKPPPITPNKSVFIVEITEKGQEKRSTIQYNATVVHHEQDALAGKKIMLRVASSVNKFELGNQVVVNQYINKIPPPKNPNTFHYKQFLAKQNIHLQTFLQEKDILKIVYRETKPNPIQQIRAAGIRYIQEFLQPKQQTVARALLLGDKTKLEQSVKNDFSHSGTMHILAVSGLHVGIVYLLFATIFSAVNKIITIPKWLQLIFIICGIWLFAMVTGGKASVLRAAMMFTLLAIGRYQFPSTNSINILAAVAFILLVVQPLYLIDVGFQMSFSAVLGILLALPLFSFVHTNNKVFNYFIDISLLSVVAQLATLPFVLYYFHQFPIYGVFANLIAIPLAFAIVATGFLGIVVMQIPYLNIWIGNLLNQLIYLLQLNNEWFSSLAFSVISEVYLPLQVAVCLGVAILCFFLFIRTKQKLLLFCSLFILFVGLCLQNWFILQASQQQQVMIYSAKKAIIIDEFSGRNSTIYTNTDIDSLTHQYTITPNHIAHAIKHKTIKQLKANQPIVLHNQPIMVITDTTKIVPSNGILLISQPSYQWLKQNNNLSQQVIILGKYRPKQLHFPNHYHFIEEDGWLPLFP